MYSAAFVWAKVIQHIENRLGPVIVSTWLDDAEIVQMDEARFILYSPSDFRRESIHRTCKQYIEEALRELFRVDLELVVWGDSELTEYRSEQSAKPAWVCNPQFNFENFIAGSSNTVPLRAAEHVACNPGDTLYNPLYLYGAPGVGKTHLLYAIANHICQNTPNLKLVCVKGEQFTNDLVQTILRSGTAEFRKKYREADVLLIDDIQFIAGKEATQEEFFHTFNDLIEHHKQIVITSDRKPSDMATLEDRLKSRFGEGVMVEITPPNPETRELIIRNKAGKLGLRLDDPTVRILSDKLCGNVRQIEGGLRKIRVYHDLSGMELTRENIARTIEDLQIAEAVPTVTPDLIVRYVCRYFGIGDTQLKSHARSKNISEPRQIAMYLIRQLTGMSLPEVGTYFGRDHGTVHHSVSKIKNALAQNDTRLENIIQDIRMSIESNT